MQFLYASIAFIFVILGPIVFVGSHILMFGLLLFYMFIDIAGGTDHWIIKTFLILVSSISVAFAALFQTISFPLGCLLDITVFKNIAQCTTENFIGTLSHVAWISLVAFPIFGISIMLIGTLLTSNRREVPFPNPSGVPFLYRFLAFFTRSAHPAPSEVDRATASEGAPTFNSERMMNRTNRPPKNVYEEILDREDLERALKKATSAEQVLRRKEAELRKKQAEKYEVASALAAKMEEIERLKARLEELNRSDR